MPSVFSYFFSSFHSSGPSTSKKTRGNMNRSVYQNKSSNVGSPGKRFNNYARSSNVASPEAMPSTPVTQDPRGVNQNAYEDDEEESENYGCRYGQARWLPSHPIKLVVDEKLEILQSGIYAEKLDFTEIPVEGRFDDLMADNFCLRVKQAIQANHKMIVIAIDSPGGYVSALDRMLGSVSMAKGLGIKVVTFCKGIAMSCGSILLGMGTPGYRYAHRDSKILLHEISGGAQGTRTNMQAEMAQFVYENSELFRKVARNSGIDEDYYFSFVKKEHKDLHINPIRALYIRLIDHMDMPIIKKTVSIDYSLEHVYEDPTEQELESMIKVLDLQKDVIQVDVLADLKPPTNAPNSPFLPKPKMAKEWEGDDRINKIINVKMESLTRTTEVAPAASKKTRTPMNPKNIF